VAGSSALESMAMNSSMSILSPIAPSALNFSSLVVGYRTGHGGPTPASSGTNMVTSTPPASLHSGSIATSTQSTMGSAASSVLESSASLNFSALVAGYRTGTQHLQATGTGAMSARSLAMRDTTSIEGPYNFDSILEENKTKKPTRTRTSTSPPKTGTGIFQVRDEHSTSSMGAGAGGQHASLTTKPLAETEPLVMPQRHEDASGSGNKVGEWLRKVSRLFTPARSRQTTFVTVPRARTGRTESLMATKTTQTM
jgi:hypothetical protein